MSLLLRRVLVADEVVDVTVDGDRVTAVGADLAVPDGAEVLDGGGGALIPGLWDHHIHLLALAASFDSVVVGPPEVTDATGLAATLRRAAETTSSGGSGPHHGWIRAVGYHESVAGPLDRDVLDRLVAGVPVRVQHRSGAMWVLNSAALARLGVGQGVGPDGHADPLERDATGRPTGRLYGGDTWLRERLPGSGAHSVPDLAAVGRHLAAAGVVGVTDATPSSDPSDLEVLAAAVTDGSLPQHVVAMGGPELTTSPFPAALGKGPVKLLLADHSLPDLEWLASSIDAAHRAGRPVAFHSVTRASLALAVAALDAAGTHPGDRIEHGSVVPPGLRDRLAGLGATVVTQPNFVEERGDQYLAEVDAEDRPHLYPCRTLQEHGVPVGGSTDAPFGRPEPWRAIAAAVHRRSASGRPVAPAEAVEPQRALDLFLTAPADPGGPVRRVVPGAPADLCLLGSPLRDVLAEPSRDAVRATVVAGRVVHRVG